MRRPANHLRKRVLLACWYYDRDHHIGIARYAAEAGWIVEDVATKIEELPGNWSGDGIISFHGRSTEFLRFLNTANANGVPVVDIGEYGHLSQFARVRTDAHEIAEIAVEFFAARGFSHVGFIDSSLLPRRRTEMQAAAERRGLSFTIVNYRDIAKRILQLDLPIGLMAATDGIAVLAMVALEQAGILIPEQVAIIGIDNDLCRCLPAPVPLTSIDTNRELLGYTAARLLGELMDHKPVPSRCIDVKPLGVIERESTDILAVNDLEVASALRFIFLNYREPIGVQDVAERSGVSLRRLQVRFKAVLNRTILDVLNDRRIEHAKRMLTETTAKIGAIADESGFGDGTRLIRAFSRCVGQTPGGNIGRLTSGLDILMCGAGCEGN